MAREDAPVRVEKRGSSTIIDVLDETLVGRQEIDRTCTAITDIIAAESEPLIVLNMRNVKQVSSSFIGWTVQTNKQIAERGGEFVMSNVRQSVFEVFEMTRLHKSIQMYRTGDVKELAQKQAKAAKKVSVPPNIIIAAAAMALALGAVVYSFLKFFKVI